MSGDRMNSAGSGLTWPGGGSTIAQFMHEGRQLFLREVNRHHWTPAGGSPAYWDQLMLDPHFGDLGQASIYMVTLVSANAENLAGLATLYQSENSLTIAHYTVARTFVENAASAWWMLSPGIEDVNPPRFTISAEEDTRLARRRLLRAMLHHADDLAQFHNLLSRLYDDSSTQVATAKQKLEEHLERLRAWSGEDIRGVRRGRTTVGGELLLGYAERVRQMLDAIGAARVPVYEMLSAYSHGMLSALVEDTETLTHADHLFFAWNTDPMKATWVAHVVLVLWERLARGLLAFYGLQQNQFDDWRDRVDTMLL